MTQVTSQTQALSVQQPQTNQLLHAQTAGVKSEPVIATTDSAILTPLNQPTLATLLQYGGVTSATIIALSIFVLAIAELLKVVMPAQLAQANETTKKLPK